MENTTFHKSTSIDEKLIIEKKSPDDKVIALAGNPNVGKSTVFNALTGMKQHTGNWPGKTVENAQGYFEFEGDNYVLVDVPGSYSLIARSAEEEVARDFICFSNPDAVIVVCDATGLTRNLNLVLQTLETGKKVVVCINLFDEARKRKIEIDLKALEKELGVPVIGTAARSNEGLDDLQAGIKKALSNSLAPFKIVYPDFIEKGIDILMEPVKDLIGDSLDARWTSIKILDGDENLQNSLNDFLGFDLLKQASIQKALDEYNEYLNEQNKKMVEVQDAIVEVVVQYSVLLSQKVISSSEVDSDKTDRKLDKIFTSKITGLPIMLFLLFLVFWITITGANYPSTLLANLLFGIEDKLAAGALAIGIPNLIVDMLIHAVYNVVAWVVSVMLPPMAIFFPMFTLLEDFGYLPRVAFNLDKYFKSCDACGKQALTMCMGYGCNAVGVTGTRIIDSPRERLIAILTNNFSPCNGRFPIMISIISIFFIGSIAGLSQVMSSTLGALILVLVILFSIGMTLLVSKILSATILKGYPSSFTLELPPYRRPQVFKVIVRSLFDRTIKVLGRAIIAAAPVGLILWLLNHINYGDTTALYAFTGFLDPFGKLLGLDGAILTGFILGLPANEIVMPIIIMIYSAQNSGLIELQGAALGQLLTNNDWTWVTAVSMLLFTVMHWPCATTMLTIKKETQSWKWTAISFLVPTVSGIIICFIFNNLVHLFI